MIFQAGSSDTGIGLAGKYADAVFTHSPSLDETAAFTRRVKQSAIEHGRQGSDVKIFPGIGRSSAARRPRPRTNTRRSATC